MGGHVATGESYEEALRRELMEELRMDVHVVTYREIGILTPHKHGTSAFMKVFLIQCNDDPDFNTNDFIEFLWLTPQEVLLRLENGDTGKGDLPRMIRLLFLREHP
jgi:isopentenyl-diphosphate delta-isomerase